MKYKNPILTFCATAVLVCLIPMAAQGGSLSQQRVLQERVSMRANPGTRTNHAVPRDESAHERIQIRAIPEIARTYVNDHRGHVIPGQDCRECVDDGRVIVGSRREPCHSLVAIPVRPVVPLSREYPGSYRVSHRPMIEEIHVAEDHECSLPRRQINWGFSINFGNFCFK
jgi:hypothetical protein